MIPKTIIDIGKKINLEAQNVINHRSQVGDQIIDIGNKINLEAQNVLKKKESKSDATIEPVEEKNNKKK